MESSQTYTPIIPDTMQYYAKYLNSLLLRFKWFKSAPSLAVGDMVLLTRVSSSPLNCPTSRKVKTSPGSDGIVWIVTVKIPAGTYVRPVTKLVPLPSDTELK